MAPSTSKSTDQCKMKTVEWRTRVRYRLQTTEFFKYISTVLFPLSISNRKQGNSLRLIVVKVCNSPARLNITQISPGLSVYGLLSMLETVRRLS